MTMSKQVQLIPESDSEQIGLLAIGVSGPWTIQIDDTTSGMDRWFAQIEGPSIYLYFEIPSPRIMKKTLQFIENFKAQTGDKQAVWSQQNDTLVLSKDQQPPVVLVRDDEFSDGYFLVVGKRDMPVVHLTVGAKDLEHFVAALHQLQEDLDDE